MVAEYPQIDLFPLLRRQPRFVLFVMMRNRYKLLIVVILSVHLVLMHFSHFLRYFPKISPDRGYPKNLIHFLFVPLHIEEFGGWENDLIFRLLPKEQVRVIWIFEIVVCFYF